MVFDYNAKKLHTFYRHVKPKGAINPLHEARMLVYEYQDKEDLLWEKLEKKYGEKVLEPYEYVFEDEDEEEEEEGGAEGGEGKAEEKKSGAEGGDDEL